MASVRIFQTQTFLHLILGIGIPFEGELTDHEQVTNHTDSPYVAGKSVTPPNLLGGNVLHRTFFFSHARTTEPSMKLFVFCIFAQYKVDLYQN